VHFAGIIGSRRIITAAGVVLALAGLLILPGCWVMSIHPLYEDVSPRDPDIVFDKGLTGSWTLTDEKCTTVLTITAKDEVYDLQQAKQGEGCGDWQEKSHQEARLLKLESSYFLDISPIPDDVCDMCIAVHWIAAARFDKETFALTPIDSDRLNKLLQARTIDLKTVPEDPKPRIIERPVTLTASAKDLKSFCRRFAGDKTVFKADSTFTFKRK
jgi:hypothetical protein